MTSGSGQGGRHTDTWGISGPGFLLIYVVLLVVTVAVVVLARRRALTVPGGAAGLWFLVALRVLTVVLVAARCLRVPHATGLGRRTLERLRSETRRPVAGASPAELGMATALFGAGVLWAADVETALALGVPREHGVLPGGGGSCGGGGGCGG